MSLNNLSATNISGALIDAGDFVINKRLVSNNQILYYTDPVTSIKTGYVWKGTLPHITSTNNPNTDGGISDTAWVPVIYSKLKEKMETEGLTLDWNAHLPTVEVSYGLTKNSLKMWKSGTTATSDDYWLYTDGTVWNGIGVLGSTPETSTGFEKITPNFNASIKTYSASATDGQTDFNIPFTFSTITVFVNGSIQLPGLNYTVSGSTLTFTTELEAGDLLYVFIGNPNISTNDKLNRIYTANAMQGQTTIQVPYDFSTAIVYINGVLQNPSTAYSIGADRIITFSEELYQDDEIIVMLGDVVVQSDEYVLKSELQNEGSPNIQLNPNITLHDYFNNSSPKLSDYINEEYYDVTDILYDMANKSLSNNTGVIIIDKNCIIDSFNIPSNVTIKILNYVTIIHKSNASNHMFIASDNTQIISSKYSKIDGNSENQQNIRYCFSATNVDNAGIEGLNINNFNAYGAYYSNCTNTFCIKNDIRNIVGGPVETAAGQYITNCINHLSQDNIISDTGSNGIKFRADSLGKTVGCRSINDRIFRAGFIGIANGKCQDHLIQNSYCVDCVDNGVDMNGCINTIFSDCISINCQDGFYIGENSITNCHIINCSARNCKRSGVGSLGSLTRCSINNIKIDGCGSGIYCSGFVGLQIIGGIIINLVKQTYYDNETGSSKTSTGRGIDIQSNLSNCHFLDIKNIMFYNNSGYDIAFGNSGIIGSLQIVGCSFMDSTGDGKLYYGGSTLDTATISDNKGYITEILQSYTITADGSTTKYQLNLPQTVVDTNYRIVSITTDWLTTSRYLAADKTVSSFSVEFGTPPTSGTRTLYIQLDRLKPR
ncbi:hypothetical protein [Klebsiella phage phiKp_21]|nr:hypothetical protein [Klebsiella phage phiKp_21]